MAKTTVANGGRDPSDALKPSDQETVYTLLRQALGIAMLIEADDGDDPRSDAAGAMVVALHKARRIMELGSEDAVRQQEADLG